MFEVLKETKYNSYVAPCKTRKLLGDIQFGFRKDKRTTDAMFVLSQLIESQKRKGKKIALAFLDIKKAYDLVDKPLLWSLRRKVGYVGKLTRIIKGMSRVLAQEPLWGIWNLER